jgi:hypothetical protein
MTQTEIFKTVNGGVSWTRSCKVGKDLLFELYFITSTMVGLLAKMDFCCNSNK